MGVVLCVGEEREGGEEGGRVGVVLCVWEKREKREKRCGGWRPLHINKNLGQRFQGQGQGCKGGNLLLGVQCGESQGIWGCSAVKNNNSFFNHGQRRN